MNNKKTAQVYHFDLYGTRDEKYEFLHNNSLKSVSWNELKNDAPNYFLVKKDFSDQKRYNDCFNLNELFTLNASGIKTERDNVTIHFKDEALLNIKNELLSLDIEDFRKKHTPKPDGRDWKIITAKSDLINNKMSLTTVHYRPFDFRRTIYTGKSKGFHSYPRNEVMRHLLKDNLVIMSTRQLSTFDFQHILVSKFIIDMCAISLQTKETTYAFPLYLYPEKDSKKATRTPNLNSEIVQKIADGLGLKFTNEKEADSGTFAPIDILDYIYAVLHSPTYREKYKEFLKIDFPRVPYPKGKETFWKLVRLGGELRQIHLLESPAVEKYITKYPADGDNVVNKIKYQDCKVYINDTQHFEGVPEVAWNFYIGGYQPAQKWLKDRKGRKLEFDDILHYQKIIVALTETDRIMKEVDEVEVE